MLHVIDGFLDGNEHNDNDADGGITIVQTYGTKVRELAHCIHTLAARNGANIEQYIYIDQYCCEKVAMYESGLDQNSLILLDIGSSATDAKFAPLLASVVERARNGYYDDCKKYQCIILEDLQDSDGWILECFEHVKSMKSGRNPITNVVHFEEQRDTKV